MTEFEISSPLEELSDPLFETKGVRVFIKRDDMIHPFISGNKFRKLKYNLARARRLNKDHLVTFGGAYSNHLVATACAGARFGLRTTGFVRGEPVSNTSLMLCRLFGMDLRFVSREQYRDKDELFTGSFGQDPAALFLDEGGSGKEAVRGCAELVSELPDRFDHVFCAAGTGTTAAGIRNGLHERMPGCELHVIPVLKNGSFILDEIARWADPAGVRLHTAYHFGGYAKTTPELLDFMTGFSGRTGILLDQVYTAKMGYAAYDLIGSDRFARGSRILLIHTGGLMGLMSQAEKILPVLPSKDSAGPL
ncbi:MAG TPA: pyridoxal-phosphate dependent enzyme [Sphingobacteriaceae bacterium]